MRGSCPLYPQWRTLSVGRAEQQRLAQCVDRACEQVVEIDGAKLWFPDEHAEELGVRNTDWVAIVTPRGRIRAKALVTRRIRPYRLKEKTVHHVGLPWHWGYKGYSTGDIVNSLTSLVMDPNVSMHEGKAFVVNVEKA